MKKATGLILLLLSCHLCGVAQQPDKYPVALTTAAITSATFPYDVPFYITGDPPANAISIVFSYKVSDREKKSDGQFRKWVTLPVTNPNGSYTVSGQWPLQSGETTYSLLCRGMHPGIHYDFRFETLKNVADDAPLKADLKQKLIARIQLFTTQFSALAYTSDNLDKLGKDLTDIIKAKLITGPNQELRVKGTPNAVYTVDVNQTLETYLGNALAASQSGAAAVTDLDGQARSAIAELRDKSAAILADINAVLGDGAKPTDNTKAMLDMPVAPSVDAFKSYTLRNALLVLKKICQPPDRISGIINRNQQIVNNDVTPMAPATQADPQNIYFLQALIAFLKDGNVATTDSGVKFTTLGDLDTYLTTVAEDNKTIADSKAQLAALVGSFPDLTTELVLSETDNMETITVPDVTTSNTPYISAEGGLGYNSAFQSVFSYLGANIYSTPINKKAPLSAFRGLDWWRKTLSLSIGFSTLYSDRPVHTASFLGGTGKSDLFIGLGFRPNRIIKFNVSAMPYYVNPNPVTPDKQLKFSLVAGIGFDVNLLGALGGVARGLNLTTQ
jgi:hypothetical protein